MLSFVSRRNQIYHYREEKKDMVLQNHDKCILFYLHLTDQLTVISIRLKYLLHLFKTNCINIIYYLRTNGNNLYQ